MLLLALSRPIKFVSDCWCSFSGLRKPLRSETDKNLLSTKRQGWNVPLLTFRKPLQCSLHPGPQTEPCSGQGSFLLLCASAPTLYSTVRFLASFVWFFENLLFQALFVCLFLLFNQVFGPRSPIPLAACPCDLFITHPFLFCATCSLVREYCP